MIVNYMSRVTCHVSRSKLGINTISHLDCPVFCTAEDGFSLLSLYRSCLRREGPALLVIKTNTTVILGAFLSQPPRLSDNFYGTGESWLFTYRDSTETVRTFAWTGENNFILQGSLDSLVVGAGQSLPNYPT